MAAAKVYAANSARAASTAEPIAYPLVTAFVVFPTASRGSVTARASAGSFAISAIPPALSVIGPNASIEMIIPVTASMLAAASPMP